MEKFIFIITFLSVANCFTAALFLDSSYDCNAEFNAAALEAHNSYRALHHVPPLTLDTKITSVASDYSQKLAFEMKSLVHSTFAGYGENLAWIVGGDTSNSNCAGLAKKVVKTWYDEVALYDYSNPGFSSRKN